MDLSTIKPAPGSVMSQGKRLGRGEGSGKGGQATRGHKGQKSVSGYSKKSGFEGGQMPIQRRLPKFGFKNINRKSYKPINLDAINAYVEASGVSSLDVDAMVLAGLVPKNALIKVLGNGGLTKKVDITAHAFSKSAKAAIEALEGSAIIL